MKTGRRGFFGFLAATAAVIVTGPQRAAARLPVVRHTAWAGKVEDAKLRTRARTREYVVGFAPVEVLPGATVELCVQPLVDFEPQRLIIPSIIAQYFALVDARVAGTPLFHGEVSALLFAETAMAPRLPYFQCMAAGRRLELVVRNLSAVPHRFMAAVIGPALDQSETPQPWSASDDDVFRLAT